jgi:polyketide cyclase/dehydrase/lipid transport protein
VFDFLDVLSNHVPFTDHMLGDWSFSGPARGAGTRARLRARTPGPKRWLDMEVIASEAPVMTRERTIGAGGKRHTTGTYTLAPGPGGGTLVTFEFAWERAPLGDRIAAPLLRGYLRHGNERALQRLKALLEGEAVHEPRMAAAA